MPRKYKRKRGVVPRNIAWSKDSLQSAFEEMKKGQKGVNEIARIHGIPSRTLRRRFAKNDEKKLTLGKHPILGFENEKRLMAHILKLGEAGFPPDRTAIRKLAYQFAQKLELKHNFDDENEIAGHSWFQSFMERNPEISVRQAEGLSIARAKGLNREEVKNFFELLTKVLTENDLLDKPDRIFNMDESGIQFNNKPGKVIAKKGSRAVKSVTFAEKGETITIVACCNAIGNFLPPVLILKGVNKKPEFEEGLPPGSKVYMQRKSAYINTELFYKWLTEHFIAHKPQGKVLLILDGHTSHSSAIDMLEAARNNDVILLCLPSHTTSALQPLDRAVFGPLKTFYNAETNRFMRANPNKKLNRYNSGELVANAWIRAATPANAISGFRGSGIYPVNPNAISESEFAISDIALGESRRHSSASAAGPVLDERQSTLTLERIEDQSKPNKHEVITEEPRQEPISSERIANKNEAVSVLRKPEQANESHNCEQDMQEPRPGTSSNEQEQDLLARTDVYQPQDKTPPLSPSLMDLPEDCLRQLDLNIESYIFNDTEPSFPSLMSLNETMPTNSLRTQMNSAAIKKTPSKFLQQSSPIPKITISMSKRNKQSAEILNSTDRINKKKEITENKNKTERKTVSRNKTKNKSSTTDCTSKENKENKEKREKPKTKNKIRKTYSSNSENEESEDDYLKLTKGRGMRKRSLKIYSSSSESEKDANTKAKKGKATKGIPIKKSKQPVSAKHRSDEDFCVECFENYNSTKSKVGWIKCITCQKWLHETCTAFRNYCSRCGKIKALAL